MVNITVLYFERFSLLGYNAVLSVGSHPKFPRNMSPPFSRVEEQAKQETRMK
jgi:hypothetical protein